MSEPTPPADAAPMPDSAAPHVPAARPFPWTLAAGLLGGIALAFLVFMMMGGPPGVAAVEKKAQPEKTDPPAVQPEVDEPEKKKIPAPELDGGVAWLNSAGPLSLKKDLKGKIVLLDFWTLCCINCLHVMPDLAKLEKKYPNELVVIGVHSPKFENEKDTNSIRKAILRYQIEHPVINDADHKVWERYEVDAWPTLVLIDPEGNFVGIASGEGNYEILDRVIGKLVEEHKKKKTLNDTPIRFDLAKYREAGDTPLFFPGKVVADDVGKRLFIADSTHHRIVVTDLDGKLIAVAGTGVPGKADGAFDAAEFHDPQGMAVLGDTLYVADRKNHTVRELDLKAKTVKTIAGTGEQEGDASNRRLDKPVPARSIGLNSPWDLLIDGDTLYVAMAGHHQIWGYDLKKRDIGPYAGSGRETIGDGPLAFAHFAQPSGLATDGKNIYVADSEISALRRVPLGGAGRVQTLVGRGLFVFGDQDGPGQDGGETSRTEARLQHALGVAHHDGKLYVADTYNNKIKVFDLSAGTLKTFIGGTAWGWFVPAVFHEPAGISYANGKLYVADTNAHRIRIVDLATKAVTTLTLTGVYPPPVPKVEEPVKPAPPAGGIGQKGFDKAVKKVEATFSPLEAKPGQTVTFTLTVELNAGYHTYPTVQSDKGAAGMVNDIKFPAAGAVVFVGKTEDGPDAKSKAEPELGILEMKYYEGKAVYTRKAVVSPKAAAGETAVKLASFKLSVCDKDTCFPPKAVPVEAKLKVLDGPAVEVEKAYADEVKKALDAK